MPLYSKAALTLLKQTSRTPSELKVIMTMVNWGFLLLTVSEVVYCSSGADTIVEDTSVSFPFTEDTPSSSVQRHKVQKETPQEMGNMLT